MFNTKLQKKNKNVENVHVFWYNTEHVRLSYISFFLIKKNYYGLFLADRLFSRIHRLLKKKIYFIKNILEGDLKFEKCSFGFAKFLISLERMNLFSYN